MTERGLPAEGAPACPFVAFEDDRDGRSTAPDHRHRCFAEARPAPRAVAHQEAYCLSSAFPVCPTFQDWARREAAAARVPGGAPPVQREEAPQGRPMPALEREPRHGSDTPPPIPPRRSQQRDWAAPPPWAGEDRGPAAGGPGRAAAAGAASGALWGAGFDGEGPDPDVPVVPPRGRGTAPSRQPSEWSSESRGLAGSAADRLAGSDAGEPAPATPRPARRDDLDDRYAPDDRYGADDRYAPEDRYGPDDRSAADPGGRDPRDAGMERGRRDRADDDLDDWGGAATGAGASVAASASARTPLGRPGDEDRYAPPSRRQPPPRGRGEDRRDPAADHASSRDHVRRPVQQDPQELFGPAWERPRRYEAYPSLRTRMGVPRGVSRLAVYGGGLVAVAAFLFLFGPRLLGLVGDGGGTGAASPTPAATEEVTPTPEPTPPPEPTPQVYEVRQGDTMSKIAKRFGVTIEDILAANPQIKNPDRIGIGDLITIPVVTEENGFPEEDGAVEGETEAP